MADKPKAKNELALLKEQIAVKFNQVKHEFATKLNELADFLDGLFYFHYLFAC
jgi:hypothetical protein